MNPYETIGEEQELYDMAPIGVMAGDCEPLELPEGLDKIKASLNSADSGMSILYKVFGGALKETYGELNDNNMVEWRFTDEAPLVGLYGRQTETGISQLGFVTLDTACQAAVEEKVDPVDPVEPTDPVVTPELPLNLDEVNTEKDSMVLGLPTMTFVLILVGVLVGIGLITASLCTLRHKKNQQNRVASPVTNKTSTVSRRSGMNESAAKELKPVAPETDIENNASPNIFYPESGKKTTNNKLNDF